MCRHQKIGIISGDTVLERIMNSNLQFEFSAYFNIWDVSDLVLLEFSYEHLTIQGIRIFPNSF